MEQELIIPKDNKEMTKRFMVDKGGICGLACLALIERRRISEVMQDWKKIFGKFEGYANFKDLRIYLEKKGYKCKFVNRDGWTKFLRYIFIARVQWIGEGKNKKPPFYGWGHWTEASAHTHFIVIYKGKKFFCNEEGKWNWIGNLNNYLRDDGRITSFIKITGENFFPTEDIIIAKFNKSSAEDLLTREKSKIFPARVPIGRT